MDAHNQRIGMAEADLAPGVALGPSERFVCVIGAFDGLHAGHRALITQAAADAHARNLPLALLTFDPDPSEVLSTRPPERLLSDADRVRSLALAGADAVLVHRFTPELAALPYDRYVTEVLGGILSPAAIHVGEDFRFGVGGAGTVAVVDRGVRPSDRKDCNGAINPTRSAWTNRW